MVFAALGGQLLIVWLVSFYTGDSSWVPWSLTLWLRIFWRLLHLAKRPTGFTAGSTR